MEGRTLKACSALRGKRTTFSCAYIYIYGHCDDRKFIVTIYIFGHRIPRDNWFQL